MLELWETAESGDDSLWVHHYERHHNSYIMNTMKMFTQ